VSKAERQPCQADASPHCEVCGVPVAVKRTGRPRRYCSNACRCKAFRINAMLSSIMVDLRGTLVQETSLAAEEDHRVT
jgi:hypothetical protein